MRFASLALLLAFASPALASAQVYLPPPPTTEALALEDARETERDLTGARALRDTGAGMTVGGLLTGALSAIILVTNGPEFSGFIVGGLGSGVSGASLLAGIPMWVAGGVRADVLSHAVDQRASAGDAYEIAGIVTFVSGIVLFLAGGFLAGSARWIGDPGASNAVVNTGGVVMATGAFAAAFIGPPMWAEGGRF